MVASIPEIKQFLSNPDNIAIVGASSKEHKAGYYVPKFLQSIGFTIVPINPNIDEFLGEKVFKSLEEVNIDLAGVVIYRKQDEAEPVAIKASELGISMIWLPDNIFSSKVEELQEAKGLRFVNNRCPLRDGRQLLNTPKTT